MLNPQRNSRPLLGDFPSTPQQTFGDSPKDFTEPRRIPLLSTESSISTTTPSRRSILPGPTTSILDRTVGLLDRTPFEKLLTTPQNGTRMPLLSEPGCFETDVPTVTMIDSNLDSIPAPRGLLDRSRTGSPRSLPSSISPGSTSKHDEDHRQGTFISPAFSKSTLLIEPIPPGFLDRETSSRSRNDSRSRSRSKNRNGSDNRRDHRSTDKRRRRSMTREKKLDRSQTETLETKGILDRSLEEKQMDISLQTINLQQPVPNSSTESSSPNDKDERIRPQSSHTPKDGSEKLVESNPESQVNIQTNNEETEERRPPRIPNGYRRMTIMVTKLTPLELKLAQNWRFCKFLADSPRVHLIRLRQEDIDAATGRGEKKNGTAMKTQDGKDTAQRRRKEQLKEVHAKSFSTVNEETVTVTSADGKPARPKKKLRQQVAEPEVVPFLNIPGMPSMESLWSFKIKKKPAEDTSRKVTSTSKDPKKNIAPQSSTISNSDAPKTAKSPEVGGKQLQKKDVDALSSILEYTSPLTCVENEVAKKRRQEQLASRIQVSLPTTSPSTSRPVPLLSTPYVRPIVVEPMENQSTIQHAGLPSTVSPSLSSSSRSSFWHDGTTNRGLTPPPTIYAAPPRRRTLLGEGPLLPTPVVGPHTPSEPSPSQYTTPEISHVTPVSSDKSSLPNWYTDSSRGEPVERKGATCEENSTVILENQRNESNTQVFNSDGTPFDPMIFLNRCSDYSSDSEGAEHAGNVPAKDVPKEMDSVLMVGDTSTKSSPKDLLSVQPVTVEVQSGRSESCIPVKEDPTTSQNANLDSESALAQLALKLLGSLNTGAGINEGATSNLISSHVSVQNEEAEEDTAYDVSQLRNSVRMLLDDQTSILQTDLERRRQAMELLPVLDELETLARLQPNSLSEDMLLPIMRFVYEIVELSTPSTNFGVSATTQA